MRKTFARARIAVGVAMLLAVVVLANIAYQTRRKPTEMTATVHSTLWPGLAFRTIPINSVS